MVLSEIDVKYVEALKWPVLILICFAVVVLVFKRQVASFLGRVDSVGKDGLRATPQSKLEQQVAKDLEVQIKKGVEDIPKIFSPEVLRERKGLIMADLKERNLDESGDTAKFLIDLSTLLMVLLEFERLYRGIFGSQIFVLKQANMKGEMSETEMAEHFEHVKKLFKPQFDTWNIDGYLAYLTTSPLLKKEEGKYRITPMGRDFLVWLAKTGYSESPPL